MGGAPSQILPNLWLGGQDVIEDANFFADRDIAYVLSLGPAAPPARIPLIGREHINVPDMPTADLSRHLARATRFIADARHKHNRCVYVHCAAGISRSTTCVVAYLMTHLGLSFQQALSFVSSRRRSVCPNEGFSRQLKRFEVSKERQELAEELARQCSNYPEVRSRDLEELHRPAPAPPAASSGPSSRRSSGAGLNNLSRPVSREKRSASHGTSGRGPPLSVEQQAQQNALQAVRQNMARMGGGRASGRQDNPEALRVGNGDAKGDVGLGWLLRSDGPTPAAGRPSGVAPPAGPRGAPSGRRSSNSQPAPSSRRAPQARG